MSISESRYVRGQINHDGHYVMGSMHRTVPKTVRCNKDQSVPVSGIKTDCPFKGGCSFFVTGVGCAYTRPEIRKKQKTTKGVEDKTHFILDIACPEQA